MTNICNKEISVIVQGAADKKITPECLKSIRKFLPGAEIILSTWEGTDASGLDYDKIVLNKDPGAVLLSVNAGGKKFYNNINRQLLSTQNGLKETGKKYAFKIRSDIVLQGAGFLDYFDKYDAYRDPAYSIFKKRILNYYLFTPRYGRAGRHNVPVLFHPSDWMFFGLTQDLKKLFDIPLQPEPETTLYWLSRKKPADQADAWPATALRYCQEQYLFYSCLKKYYPRVKFENYMDITREKEDFSRRLMVNNFTILDFMQWKIKNDKYGHVVGTLPAGQTSHAHWLLEYKKYCNPCLRKPYFLMLRMLPHADTNIGYTIDNYVRWFVIKFFKPLYKKNLYRKYSNSPVTLAMKLQAMENKKAKKIYNEDKQDKEVGHV